MPDNVQHNELGAERSPYLLQHAHNPVAWQAWSDDVFRQAAELNRPVFVSVGYSTCHWCHVMAHESFEDNEVASFLNEHFISVKVDREEHPDVDAYCMEVCQVLTGHGGWPLTLFFDESRRPFFAGTYFPKRSSQHRIGFLELLNRIHEVWTQDRSRLDESATQITAALAEHAQSDMQSDVPANVLDVVADHHRRMYDAQHGGFGSHPKFPSPQHLLILLRIAHRTNDAELRDMVMHTLRAMRAGGMYDQVEFGFHRYSTDREWRVPHFEKMLYDQAMLMMAYCDAWKVSRSDAFKRTVLEIAEYLRRRLTSPTGAFYSSQDADSEGVEGKYYVWSADELGEHAAWLTQNMHVRTEGNFSDEASGEDTGLNILYCDPSLDALDDAKWSLIREHLRLQREPRIHPGTDTKILADWNGLMISALAQAAGTFNDEALRTMAENAFNDVWQRCRFDSNEARHVGYDDVDGNAYSAYLDDYAMIGCAALSMFQASGVMYYVEMAEKMARVIVEKFTDDSGRLTLTSRDHVRSFHDVRNETDSAYPSGNSMAAELFIGLAACTHDDTWLEHATRCITSVGKQVSVSPQAFCMLMCTWDTLQHGYRTIEFRGGMHSEFIEQQRTKAFQSFLPGTYVLWNANHSGEAEIVVCTQSECLTPITDPEEFQHVLTTMHTA